MITRKKQALVSLTLMAVISFYLVVNFPKPAYAMHIMEGAPLIYEMLVNGLSPEEGIIIERVRQRILKDG